MTRSGDLACKILSPGVVGLIMTYASLLVSAVVIAVWNVFSLVGEYLLLTRVYRLVPALAVKQSVIRNGQFLMTSWARTPGSVAHPKFGQSENWQKILSKNIRQ